MDHLGFITERLEFARETRGISVKELARRSGIDYKRLWNILNNKRAIRGDELVRLSYLLGLGMSDYLPLEMRNLLDAWRTLTVKEFGKGSVFHEIEVPEGFEEGSFADG